MSPILSDELSAHERQRLASLDEYVVKLRQLASFLHSVILAGEEWSRSDEEAYAESMHVPSTRPDHAFEYGASPDGDVACARCGESEESHA